MNLEDYVFKQMAQHAIYNVVKKYEDNFGDQLTEQEREYISKKGQDVIDKYLVKPIEGADDDREKILYGALESLSELIPNYILALIKVMTLSKRLAELEMELKDDD
jgi:hypothetical protein